MGLRYTVFRASHEIEKKLGILESKFSTQQPQIKIPSLIKWKRIQQSFFKWDLDNLPKQGENAIKKLTEQVENFKNEEVELFGGRYFDIPFDEWHINPFTRYKYSNTTHWSKIPEFTKEAGDIKYVWEKARFGWVYNFIRYDKYAKQDSSKFVFDSILSFIEQNPINQGPNYICSQEISIRILNWVFVLYYYKDSEALNEDSFYKILTSINAQITHVYTNINFSRIAVRNNHAITETLTLYLIGLLFPFLPDVQKWKEQGKKWFEQEVEYQIYEDGSYLQYSMNYHRVVVQLLSWGIIISDNNGEKFAPVVYERAKKSIEFLESCQDPVSRQLPHYGANDGALFFPLNSLDYRNYSPQLNALKASFGMSINALSEDCFWLGLKPEITNNDENKHLSASQEFLKGGYYTYKEENTLTFIRCGSHPNRPSQADNLHLDIWVNGQNLLRDSGTYLYNGSSEEVAYYNSTKAHNVVQVDEEDQMKRGTRFIWFNWTQVKKATMKETDEYWSFSGVIRAFDNLEVHRTVKKYKSKLIWEIEDQIPNKPNHKFMHQHWHPNKHDGISISFTCKDGLSENVNSNETQGWFAPNYGKSSKVPITTFSTLSNYLFTRIEIKA